VGKCGFSGVEPWNGQLFHVEQLGKGRNYAGFTVYSTVKNTVGPVFFTVGTLFLTVKFVPPVADGFTSPPASRRC